LTKHLFVISVGSVQDFISAARRTRDLWFGSHLLSEISKAAANAIAENHGELIFPALKAGSYDLRPSDDETAFNVANIIVAELPESIKDPLEINRKARIAAKKIWLDYAAKTRDEVERLDGGAIEPDIWDEQVNDVDEETSDVIPIYSAWVTRSPDYQKDRKRLMRLLSGRKSIRDFNPPAGHRKLKPKSSLDGARESVLTKNKDIRKKLSLRLRLGNGEQLCAVGLTKRLGGGKVPFPSVVRVAADPWIRGVISYGKGAKDVLDEIGYNCSGENGFSSGTGRLYKEDFGYDGQIFYRSRLNKLLRLNPDSDSSDDNLTDTDRAKLVEIKKKVDLLQTSGKDCFDLGEPDPYLSILMADGDHMGRAISLINRLEDH